MKVLKVGLTGNIGTGKSTVAKLFKKYGANVLDADKVVHRLLERKDIKEKLIQKLGKDILKPDGIIDRRKIAEKVFKDKKLLKWLENLLHPEVYKEYENFCKRRGGICILEAALIFEKGNKDKFDKTIVVYAPKQIAKERSSKYRGLSEEEFEKRWKLQMNIEKKRKLADFVIDNSGSLENTEKQIKEIMEKLRGLLEGEVCQHYG